MGDHVLTTTIYTNDGSPLTEARELEILRPSLHGVYEGLAPKHGSADFRVTISSGLIGIRGVLAEEAAEQTDLFDVGASADDRHIQVYAAYFPGDSANDPLEDAYAGVGWAGPTEDASYANGELHLSYIEGTYADPANIIYELEGSANSESAKYVVVLGDIFIPASAADITDARFVLPDLERRPEDIWKALSVRYQMSVDSLGFEFDTTYGGADESQVVLKWGGMHLLAPSMRRMAPDPASGGLTSIEIKGSDTNKPVLTEHRDLVIDNADDAVLVYARLGRYKESGTFDQYRGDNFFQEHGFEEANTANLLLYPIDIDTMEGSDSITDALYQEMMGVGAAEKRPEMIGVVPLGLVRRFANGNHYLHLINGEVVKAGQGILNGFNSTTPIGIKSSGVYSTTETAESDGYADIDDVITNLSALNTLGLDTAYDTPESGADAGSGRQVTIDAGALELINAPGSVASPNDPWMAAMRVSLSTGDGSLQKYSQPFQEAAFEAAVDIENSDSDYRVGLRYRAPLTGKFWESFITLKNIQCFVDWSSPNVLIKPVEPTSTSTITASEWSAAFDDKYVVRAQAPDDLKNSCFVTFSNMGGIPAENKVYQVYWSDGNTHLHALDANGDDAAEADFTNIASGPIEGQCTFWYVPASIQRTTHLDSLKVWHRTYFEEGVRTYDKSWLEDVQLDGEVHVTTEVAELDEGMQIPADKKAFFGATQGDHISAHFDTDKNELSFLDQLDNPADIRVGDLNFKTLSSSNGRVGYFSWDLTSVRKDDLYDTGLNLKPYVINKIDSEIEQQAARHGGGEFCINIPHANIALLRVHFEAKSLSSSVDGRVEVKVWHKGSESPLNADATANRINVANAPGLSSATTFLEGNSDFTTSVYTSLEVDLQGWPLSDGGDVVTIQLRKWREVAIKHVRLEYNTTTPTF